jgi:hypothetical protein
MVVGLDLSVYIIVYHQISMHAYFFFFLYKILIEMCTRPLVRYLKQLLIFIKFCLLQSHTQSSPGLLLFYLFITLISKVF